MLSKQGKAVAFREVAIQLLDQASANVSGENKAYSQAHAAQVDKVDDSELTPSGRIMQAIAKGESFTEHMMAQAKKHKEHFSKRGLPAAMNVEFKRLAQESLRQQTRLESSDIGSFDDFLSRYNAP